MRLTQIAQLAFLLHLFPVGAQMPEKYEMAHKIIRFERHYNEFFRKFFGCPEDPNIPANAETCRFPHRSVLDYRSFMRAREAAKDLFVLTDPRLAGAGAEQ